MHPQLTLHAPTTDIVCTHNPRHTHQVSQKDEYLPGTKDRYVMITGSAAAQQMAHTLVFNKIREAQMRSMQPQGMQPQGMQPQGAF